MMNKKTEKKRISSCDICMNYTYDEDYECYTCEVDLDEDEMEKFMSSSFYNFLWLRHLFAGIVPRQQSESILQQQKLLKVHVSSSFLLGFVRLLIQKYNNKTREKRVCNQEKEFFI